MCDRVREESLAAAGGAVWVAFCVMSGVLEQALGNLVVRSAVSPNKILFRFL
jgi:hypothetical protein